MNTLTEKNTKEKFLEIFKNYKSLKTSLNEEGLDALKKLDFPDNKNEDWKYTRTHKIARNTYQIIKGKNADVDDWLTDNSLVFINGFYNPQQSSANHLYKSFLINNPKNTAYFKPDKNIFTALNAAYYTDGLYLINSPHNHKKITVIHYNSDNALANIHHYIHIQKNTQAEIEFIFLSDENINLTNIVTQIKLEENAKLTLNILQNEKPHTSQINLIHVHQQANSEFNITTCSLGGELTRNNLNIYADGQNCTSNLNGIYITNNQQHIDNHTLIDHLMPNCQSNETYKGVMSGKSTGVFNGKVYVRPNAQKINAYQSNANILLSDDASINTKPELEIYADDVKCSHGSTTGQLDEEALFYLRARGIGEQQAKKILVHAFVAEVTQQINDESFRTQIQNLIDKKLSAL
jgi:Fe-S cluster assembly protein SufD